jgi:hypothetical protein
MRPTLAIWIIGLGLVAASAGCAKAQARSAPEGPPLEMPAPPPRVLGPIDEPLPAAQVASEPATPPPPRTTPRSAPRDAAKTEPPQKAVEPPPEQPPPVVADTKPAEPPRTLRAQPAGRDNEMEKTIRDTLTRASRDLSRVDYSALTADGRDQYEQSKRFMQQTEQALKDRNFVYAQTLADKAAQLAAVLLGR